MGYFIDNVVISFIQFILISSLLINFQVHGTEDKHHWRKVARDELKEALNYKWNTNTAKNVILFLGDGMSPDTVTATRIYNNGEESFLAWEKFPHIGLLKTYDSNKQVPDSASTATAVFCGVKTNYEVAGVDAKVKLGDCEASLDEDNHLESIIAWGQAAGKDTGFVTTTRVTHATPSALYAHTANRKWECERDLSPEAIGKCKDIGRQLMEDYPGKNLKVIMGGGRQTLQSNATSREDDPIDTWACHREDGRKLMDEWTEDKEKKNVSHAIVENYEELFKIDPDEIDFLLGIFANGHMSMDWERNTGPKGQPSLENMTTAAVKILQKSDNGFILVIEGGLIDYGHHRGHAAQALLETLRLHEAVEATLKLVDLSETLVIVTSDHSHAMTFNGISERGSNILGVAKNSDYDGIPYTTLGYSTGGPNNMAYEVNNSSTAKRKDPSLEDTTAFTYSQQAAIVSDEAQHSGGDVVVYAIGPYAHLFHSTHEQNFVAHVIAFSSGIGEYYRSGSESVTVSTLILAVLILPFLR